MNRRRQPKQQYDDNIATKTWPLRWRRQSQSRCAGVVALVTLAYSARIRSWSCAGVVAVVALASSLSLRRHRWNHCAGATKVVTLASSPSSRWHLRRVFTVKLCWRLAMASSQSLQRCRWSCCVGVITLVVLALSPLLPMHVATQWKRRTYSPAHM